MLRIDPIIPTTDGIGIAHEIYSCRADTRVRISFMDQYQHVRSNLAQVKFHLPYEDFHAPLELRRQVWEDMGKPEVCGEPGLPCTGCVSTKDCEVLGVEPITGVSHQRATCACLANKKELLTCKSPCHHGCLYCYWRNINV